MATIRTMHKRRQRREARAGKACLHPQMQDYPDGSYCRFCNAWFPVGYFDWEDVDVDYDDYDSDYDGECFHCAGEGWIDGYEDDQLWYAPGEMQRCASCGGSGQAKDMTIW